LLYHFLVVQGAEPQAYSFPDGTIGLTEALAQLFGDDDQLAFAMAHEIAHVALRHHIAAFRLRQAAGSDRPPERLMLETIQGQFSSSQEMEADRYGALYAVRAGFEVSAAVEALKLLAADPRLPASGPGHPNYARRVAALESFRDELELTLEAFDEGTASLRAGEAEKAIEALEYFVATFPRSVSGRVNLGSAYLAKVRRSGGTPHGLAEVLPVLPDHGIVVRGAYDQLDLEEARLQFGEALQVDPQDVTALAGLALVEIRLGELPRARELLDEALLVEPDDPDLLLCSGNVHYLGEAYDAAAEQYVAALSIRPAWSSAQKNLALTYESQGRWPEAHAIWKALKDDERYGAEARDRARDIEREELAPVPEGRR
jgi:predicted Zn-dependent protease